VVENDSKRGVCYQEIIATKLVIVAVVVEEILKFH
jgi:hypothetical protein